MITKKEVETLSILISKVVGSTIEEDIWAWEFLKKLDREAKKDTE